MGQIQPAEDRWLKLKAVSKSSTPNSTFYSQSKIADIPSVFWIKKLVGYFISPVYSGIGLVIIGLWLHWRVKSKKLSRAFIVSGVLIPTIAFNSGLADLLNRHLEFT